MKILFVTTISPTIGFLIPHIKFLVEKGYEVDVAFNITKEVSSELIDLGCKIYNIEFQRSPLSKDNCTAYKKIKQIVRNGNYRLIHTHTPIASFITRMACRNIPNLKILYTAHGFHFLKGAPMKNWLIYYPAEKLAARWTDALITMNEEDYKIAQKFKIRDNGLTHKVHGVGVDLNKFQPQTKETKIFFRKEYGFKEEDFILFYAAELNYNKHQDLLIDTIDILKDKIPNIKLLLAGTGHFKNKYENKINELGLNSYIKLLGLRRDVPNLLTLSDIAVASSRREGLPVNVMEAMASGLPLVVTDIRGHRDLVDNMINGYTIGVNDTIGFANAIENLYEDSKLREKYGINGQKLVQKYSLENVITEMEEIYEFYLGGK